MKNIENSSYQCHDLWGGARLLFRAPAESASRRKKVSLVKISVTEHSMDEAGLWGAIGKVSSYFTHPAYLESLIKQPPITVGIGSADGFRTLIFRKKDDGLICCNRLERLSPATLDLVADALFARTDVQYLSFEDLDYVAPRHFSSKTIALSYQENWRCDLHDSESQISNRQKSQMRRRRRQLQEALEGRELKFRLSRCTEADIEQVMAFNRRTIEARGSNYSFKDESLDDLKAVCSEDGYTAGLYADDQLVAADILTISGGQAYFHVVGYDMAYKRFSPGLQVHAAAVEACKEMGCDETHYLWGNSRWKSDMGGKRIPLSTVIVARNSATFLHPGYWRELLPHLKRVCSNTVKPPIIKLRNAIRQRLR